MSQENYVDGCPIWSLSDDVAYKTTKEKVKSLALKAKVTREQTSDDSDNQGGSDEDEDEDEVEEFNLISDKEDDNESQKDTTCLMAVDSQEVCLKCDLLPDDWILDSGFTKHMTGNRRFFTSYKAYDGEHVVFRSNLKGKVIGGGNTLHDSITIINVEHVSGLAFNLISVDNLKQQICLESMVDNSKLWRRRLGHANLRLAQNLASNELVRNLPKLNFKRHFYDTCGLGSQGNVNNGTRNEVSTSRVLELLH
ncbi:retrovirus-related pol polyprotein from transposon TNT 1-94 [Tanacetum coccineum]